MKLEQSFEVTAPLQRVWEALIDVERVAPCLPGAAITGRNDDGSYNGEFKVKIGPTSASYSGKLNMESVDESAHQATMDAAGTDKRGQGGAKATIQSSVEKVDAGTTKVNVLTDYHITGRLARFGRGGMIEEISNRLLREFASNLQEMLAGDGEDAADTAETAIVEDSTGATAGSSATAGGEYADAKDAGAAGADAAGAVDASAAAGTAGAEQAEVASEDGEGAGAGDGAAESGASPAETTAAAQEPPLPQAGSQGEPGDPAHATEATDESDVSSGRANAPADDPFAPPVPPPPPSGVAAGSAPPPPETPPRPPDNEPVQGLSLVGGALVGQVKSNPAPFVGALVAILIALGLLRRRGRG